MSKRDYYQVLGVERGANEDEIKKAYRKLAMQFHPDRNPDNKEAEDRFKEASEAYEVLHDPQKRRTYDQFGHEGLRGSGFSGFSGVEDIFSNFGDIFETFFGGGFGGARRSSGRQGRRGEDLAQALVLQFEEAIFGTEKELQINRRNACEHCKGSGAKAGSGAVTCPSCQGYGQVRHSQGFFSIATTCPQCGGEGEVVKDPCKHCHGQGLTEGVHKLSVKIPPGVDQGTSLRVTGEGHAAVRGGRRGDLYVVLEIKPHEKFVRDSQDIHSQVFISYPLAVLGGEIEVETLIGEKELEIPSGTESGTVFRIKGAGVPSLQGYSKGNHLVQVMVEVPAHPDKHEKELLRQLDQINREKRHKKEAKQKVHRLAE